MKQTWPEVEDVNDPRKGLKMSCALAAKRLIDFSCCSAAPFIIVCRDIAVHIYR